MKNELEIEFLTELNNLYDTQVKHYSNKIKWGYTDTHENMLKYGCFITMYNNRIQSNNYKIVELKMTTVETLPMNPNCVIQRFV